jgi:hypothetical protein
MVEEADAEALAVRLMMLMGCPPEDWVRLVRLCVLLRAEFRRTADALDSGVDSW